MNKNTQFEGSIVALVTPMQNDGRVDYAALSRLIEWHISAGTHGIVSVGTTGESSTLNVDEHLQVVEHTVKTVAGRIPVIAGAGGNSTAEAIHLTRHAEKLNADAALLVVPYYNKPNQEGLYQHYKAIADAVPIAQILYNVPARTALDMNNDTIARLADIDNIVACKEATGDLERGKELIDRCAAQINILSGDDGSALELIKLGGRGDISVTANVAPALMSQMCTAALTGDMGKAEQLDAQLRALHDALFVDSSPIPVKYLLAKMGYTENVLRLPLITLSSEYEASVDAAARAAGVLT